MLTSAIKKFICIHAHEDMPHECCGVLIKNPITKKISIFRCKNISETPEKCFIMRNQDIHIHGLDNIIAFYHSHPNGIDFSLADIAFSEKLKKICILYSVQENLFKEYKPCGAKLPYVGRPYFLGTLDCFTLFQDYYRRELNIYLDSNIDDYEECVYSRLRSKDFDYTKVNVNSLNDYFLSHDFQEVETPKKHDIIITKAPQIKFPVHILVYLGENKVLHHFREFSEIENYSNAYKRLTTNIYRHISFI